METKSFPKVVVGVPMSSLYEYCLEEFIASIKSFDYPNYDILLVDNSYDDKFYDRLKSFGIEVAKLKYYKRLRSRVTESHNLLRQKVLNDGYDYLFVLDQDVIPPKDAIIRLVGHNKGVVAGLYFGHHFLPDGTNCVMPFAWTFTRMDETGFWGDTRYLTDDEVWSNKLIEVAFTGGGCILIHRSVLEKIKFRYDTAIEAWDDRWLGYDVHKENLKFYLDTAVKCRHLYLKRPFSWQKVMNENKENY